MNPDVVRERAADLPREPGVYQFLDADGHPLYVGKAVDVRDRVRSYADPRSARIRRMLDRARDVEVAVTETESQALLLEANLIKRHSPRYNVRLKDDKSYPVVALTDHEFPRIEVTRDPPEGATVFGPFTTVGTVESVVKALREVYGVRGCSDHKFAGRERPCLDYDIGLCTAPCTDEISRKAYREDVESVERFFAGETGILAEPLRRAMAAAAQNEQFERAANLRDSLSAVERFHEAGDAAVQTATDEYRRTDVLGVSLAGEPCVALFRAEDGKLIDRERHPIALPEGAEQRIEAGEVLGAFIPQYYAERDLPDLLLCPERPVGEGLDGWLGEAGVECRVPASGRERTLVSLAMKNASRYRGEGDAAAALAEELGLDSARRIEGFDVSHAQGRAAVGSNVTFEDGSPDKSGYRRKKLEDTNDDYANMRRLLRWRAERALAGRDDRPDPDLLLIDGGESQVSAACEALAETGWEVPVVGLAKAEERVLTPDGPLAWPSDAAHLQLLQRVRDEAHRFAVAYHQTIRDEVATPLDDVPGVGPELRKRLLRRFGGVDGVRRASTAELQDIEGIGMATADRITTHLS